MDETWLRLRKQRNAHVAREAQRAAAIILCRIEPHLVARLAPQDAARPTVVRALLARDSTKLRRHTWATLRGLPPSLLAALTPTLVGHAASCPGPELSEIASLIASAPDVLLVATPQVLPPARVLLRQPPGPVPGPGPAPPSTLLRARRTLALSLLIRLAGPHLDALLHDAQVMSPGEGVEGAQARSEDTDAAKDA